MSKQENVIKLLLIEDSVEEAEQLISMLRNGGIAVRPARAGNTDELKAQLATQTPDLLLVNLTARGVSLKDASAAANATGKDIAVIAVAAKADEDTVANAFTDGARALTLRNRAEHVQSIVRREFEALLMRHGDLDPGRNPDLQRAADDGRQKDRRLRRDLHVDVLDPVLGEKAFRLGIERRRVFDADQRRELDRIGGPARPYRQRRQREAAECASCQVHVSLPS